MIEILNLNLCRLNGSNFTTPEEPCLNGHVGPSARPEIDAVHGLRDGEKLSCKVQWHFCSVQVTHWFPGTLARLFRKCGREKDSQTNNANLGFQRVFFWGGDVFDTDQDPDAWYAFCIFFCSLAQNAS